MSWQRVEADGAAGAHCDAFTVNQVSTFHLHGGEEDIRERDKEGEGEEKRKKEKIKKEDKAHAHSEPCG